MLAYAHGDTYQMQEPQKRSRWLHDQIGAAGGLEGWGSGGGGGKDQF